MALLLMVLMSVCPFVYHTGAPRLNGNIQMCFTLNDRNVFIVLMPEFVVVSLEVYPKRVHHIRSDYLSSTPQ